MLANYFIVSVMLIPCLCYGIVHIDRNVRDTVHGFSECSTFVRASGMFSCTCNAAYTTMMSTEKKSFDCLTPAEIGCTSSLVETNQAYLITQKTVKKKLIYPLSKECQSINRTFVWNVDNQNIGTWFEITDEASSYFILDWNSTFANSSLVISNLDNKLWTGQLIKIELGTGQCNKCLIVKVKGAIYYPIDINKFKSSIFKQRTTKKTSTRSTKPTLISKTATPITTAIATSITAATKKTITVTRGSSTNATSSRSSTNSTSSPSSTNSTISPSSTNWTSSPSSTNSTSSPSSTTSTSSPSSTNSTSSPSSTNSTSSPSSTNPTSSTSSTNSTSSPSSTNSTSSTKHDKIHGGSSNTTTYIIIAAVITGIIAAIFTCIICRRRRAYKIEMEDKMQVTDENKIQGTDEDKSTKIVFNASSETAAYVQKEQAQAADALDSHHTYEEIQPSKENVCNVKYVNYTDSPSSFINPTYSVAYSNETGNQSLSSTESLNSPEKSREHLEQNGQDEHYVTLELAPNDSEENVF